MLRLINEGAYGKVWLHQKGAQVRAVKELKCVDDEDGFTIVVVREIMILRDLHHVNVVRLHDIQISADTVYMTMEFLPMSLQTLIPKNGLRIPHVRQYTSDILHGLEYLHRRHIMHRDLKPENLLYGMDARIKIADFGLSRWTLLDHPSYTPGMVTLWYRAPELLLGHSYDQAVDMWSVGCIVFEMRTSKVLFRASSEMGMLHVIAAQSKAEAVRKRLIAASGDDACGDFAMTLLRESGQRLSAASALAHAFFCNEPQNA